MVYHHVPTRIAMYCSPFMLTTPILWSQKGVFIPHKHGLWEVFCVRGMRLYIYIVWYTLW